MGILYGNGRMNLNLIHIHCIRADGFRHRNALSECTGCIGGHISLQRRLILLYHFLICGKTSRGNDNCLSLYCNLAAILCNTVHAANLSAVLGNLIRCNSGKKLNLIPLLQILLKNRNHIRSNRNHLVVLIYRTMDSLHGSTSKGTNVMNRHTEFL